MKTAGIIPNLDKDKDLSYTNKLVRWLEDQGVQVLLSHQAAHNAGHPDSSADWKELYTRADFLIVLGGDGTILKVSKNAALYDIPLLGINLGTLGYLTDVERHNGIDALTKVLQGDYRLEKRMMLDTVILSRDTENENRLSLNETCITKGVFTTMIELELWVNDEYIDTYRGDGILVATPTGSTAYNLSAGGPVLKPELEMLIITPVCAHMLFTRSFLVAASDVIRLKLVESSRSEGLLVMDGQTRVPLQSGDEIRIQRASCCTTIIKTQTHGFYEILRQKMEQGYGHKP